jgi:hypothetical protein
MRNSENLRPTFTKSLNIPAWPLISRLSSVFLASFAKTIDIDSARRISAFAEGQDDDESSMLFQVSKGSGLT